MKLKNYSSLQKNVFPLRLFFLWIVLLLAITSCSKQKPVIKKLNEQSFFVFPAKKYYRKAFKISRYFERRNKLGAFNGVVLFAQNGKIIYEKAFGYSNFRKRKPLNLKTAFQLASVSKTITAVAVLMLVNRNKLSLQDTLGKFFPDFPYKKITVENLLSHRSGLPEYMYIADSLWQDKRNICLRNKDVLDILYNFRPTRYYPPDKRYNYSNTNFALLALIIEKVSGKSYSEFLKEEIFRPLKMNSSFVKKCGGNNCKNIAYGYIRWHRKVYDYYLDGVVGDKGIYSTVEDLFKFDSALNSGKLIPQELLLKAFTPQNPDLYKQDNYGLGWRINEKRNGDKIVFHTGWWRGFRSDFIKSLKDNKTIILLSNQSDRGIVHLSELTELFGIRWR